jgi:serine/threonine-protein kinase
VANLETGTLVAERYRLERLLGEGGMGEVWSATHEITGGRVALKFLKAANMPRAEARKRFLREARAAALVDHPNIVQIRDVIEHEDMPVLVMDLLHGETLHNRLGKRGCLDLDETARIAIQIVGAVGAAHEAGLIHRDLKPENVFLAKVSGSGELARVLDFGIAKLIDDGLDGATVTQSGTVVGTPAYMAPEQLFGERELDYRIDVWALGVMLHEVLTGVRPIDGDNYGQIAKKLLSEPVRSVAVLRPDLPADVIDLVDRMLVREPENRLSDLREAVEVFARYAATRKPSFGPPRMRAQSEPTSTPTPEPHLEPEPRSVDPSASTLLQGMPPPRLDTATSHITSSRNLARTSRPVAVAAVLGVLVLLGLAFGFRSVLSGTSKAGTSAASLPATGAPRSSAPSGSTSAPVSDPSALAVLAARVELAAPPLASVPAPTSPLAGASATSLAPETSARSTSSAKPAPTTTRGAGPAVTATVSAPSSALTAAPTVATVPPTPPTATGGLVTKPPF